MKTRFVLISAFLSMIAISPAHAGRVEPTSVPCLYFRGEKLELQQNCVYESTSWTGGGNASLRWQDGVTTKMTWGLQGRGDRPCPDWSLDGICASFYYRSQENLRRFPTVLMRHQFVHRFFRCVQARQNSVCWKL
jgi:hypothetical protein